MTAGDRYLNGRPPGLPFVASQLPEQEVYLGA